MVTWQEQREFESMSDIKTLSNICQGGLLKASRALETSRRRERFCQYEYSFYQHCRATPSYARLLPLWPRVQNQKFAHSYSAMPEQMAGCGQCRNPRRAYATFEASLQKCPHCDRRFNDRAFLSHQKSCTRVRPAKPAGTGLIANSLSNRIVPGKVAGSRHAYSEVWVLARKKPQGGWWGLRSKSAPKSRPKPVPQTESNLRL